LVNEVVLTLDLAFSGRIDKVFVQNLAEKLLSVAYVGQDVLDEDFS
jgi:hypothetical protein